MSAKEMFEKLYFDYIFDKDNNRIIYKNGRYKIIFDFDFRDIEIKIKNSPIKLELLQAINKQVEELGW